MSCISRWDQVGEEEEEQKKASSDLRAHVMTGQSEREVNFPS